MIEKFSAFGTELLYAIVAISGASGGCLVVAHRIIKGRRVSFVLLAAYAFMGSVFAVVGMAAMLLMLGPVLNVEQALIVGAIFGVSGSSALAASNLSVRFILKRLGIDIEITISKHDKK
jgi:hypothetical protein